MDIEVNKYSLSRDAPETDRLNAQHRNIITNVGYALHPDIVRSLPQESLCIADVATGTGVMMKELAEELPPPASFYGFDISDAQFSPDNINVPSQHMEYHVHDATKPFPPEFSNKFDVVCIRYITAAMDSPEMWHVIASNVASIIKPGGWIQWQESNFEEYLRRPMRSGSDPVGSAWALHKIFTLPAAFVMGSKDLKGVFRLPDTLSNLGFKSVSMDSVALDRVPETRAAGTEVSARGVYGILQNLIKAGVVKMSPDEAKTLFDESLKEIYEKGLHVQASIYTVIGQKS